ncbi:Protein N-terminal glutamine amidohydrolase [Dichanthelium oligosanthes]|uniref:Protein N-terminal glutamine amidohydrolase n=1 Tax=Dichanthelium oligosanthes TaxID=888268 RepID=A0A1E5UK26_9POAL|nr:Protein N-terminal glutamine amidohydrolase [Dichanthelium oligosanthes]
MLCKELIRIGVADPMGTDLYVVFISNEEKKVILLHIFLLRNNGEVLDLVWDLDSNLPFPSTFIQYVYNAIQPLAFGNSMYRRLFRVVHAPSFLQSFASDRSHMKDPAGNWIQLPPKYNPIMAADGTTNNLNEYITMSVEDVADLESMVKDVYSNKHGVVVNETILPRFFSRLHGSHP